MDATPQQSPAAAIDLCQQFQRLEDKLNGILERLATIETNRGFGAAPEAFNLRDCCRVLGGLSERQVRRLILAGYLDRIKGIRKILISRASVLRYVRQNC